MACLDTSFLIDLLRGKGVVKDLKEELDRVEKVLAIATPSISELWRGALLSGNPPREKEKIITLIHSLIILPFDETAAMEAAEIEAELIQKGSMIDTEDIMIAAIARRYGEKLVTRDEHFTRISSLRVLKY